jgi:hypothetical protein
LGLAGLGHERGGTAELDTLDEVGLHVAKDVNRHLSGRPAAASDALDVVRVASVILTGDDPWPPLLVAAQDDDVGGGSDG